MFTLNNDPDFVEYEFSLVNNHVVSRKRSYDEIVTLLRAQLRR